MEKSPFTPIPYTESVETIPSDEPVCIAQAIERLESILRGDATVHGHIHAKTHAHVQAEFRVLPNLSQELAQGVFGSERQNRAIVRFSNSAAWAQADYIPDGRGVAIKVLEVQGPRALDDVDADSSQDFLMVNHPSFFASDIRELLRLEEILTAAKDSTIEKLQKAVTGGGWNPLNWHWRTAVTALQTASHLPMHPAQYTYYSMAPIRFGAYVAKYRVKPVGDLPASVIDAVSKLGQHADAMRLMLEETLATQQIMFEFQVQLRTSSETMPVENASIEWPESQSPYRTVALLLIPRQDIHIPPGTTNPRTHVFSVWNAIEGHRPLGGINRLRRAAYPLSASQRFSEAGMQTATTLD